jgi:hypothetical protein
MNLNHVKINEFHNIFVYYGKRLKNKLIIFNLYYGGLQ